MSKIKEVLRLKYLNQLSNRQIQTITGVSRNSVANYVNCFIELEASLEDILELTEPDLEQLFHPNKSSQTAKKAEVSLIHPDWNNVRVELSKKGMTRALLYEEYKNVQPELYSYSQMQVALEHLELLPKILEKLTLIEKKLEDSQSKRWMNVKELGKYLGYSVDHIYKLRDDTFFEGIHFHKRGKLLFDRIEIDKWVIGADTSNKRQELKNNIDAILNSVLHKNKISHCFVLKPYDAEEFNIFSIVLTSLYSRRIISSSST